MRGQYGQAAREELGALLKSLNPGDTFYIFLFNSSGFLPMPAAEPMAATGPNIESMLDWCAKQPRAFGSRPVKAVAQALKLKPKTLWLISDGRYAAACNAAITQSNQTVRAVINTVGIISESGQQRLRDLAEKNGGTFRFVPEAGNP